MREKIKKFWQKIKPAVISIGKLLIVIITFILIMCIIGSVWRSCKLRAKADNIKSATSSLSEDTLQTFDGKFDFLLPVGLNQSLESYYTGTHPVPKGNYAVNIFDSIYMSFPINLGFNTAFFTLPDYSIDSSSSKINYNYKTVNLGEIKLDNPIPFSFSLFAWQHPTYQTDLVQVYDCVYDPNNSNTYLSVYNGIITFYKYGAFNNVKSYLYTYFVTPRNFDNNLYYDIDIYAHFYSITNGYSVTHSDYTSSDYLTVFKLSLTYAAGNSNYRCYSSPYIPYLTHSGVYGNTYISYVNPSETYENGYNNGYNQGYTEGKQQGNTEGYNNGYNKGYSDGHTAPEYSFTEFFTGFGQSFISIWDGITNHTFLGINIGGLVGVTLMISIVAIVVKKIGK